jgi:hypothetical protein
MREVLIELFRDPICCHKKLWQQVVTLNNEHWIDLNGLDFR